MGRDGALTMRLSTYGQRLMLIDQKHFSMLPSLYSTDSNIFKSSLIIIVEYVYALME